MHFSPGVTVKPVSESQDQIRSGVQTAEENVDVVFHPSLNL